ncbi:MAG: MFS transporter [Albidovulum sp.]|nr:MFS transporter [Albidovulum sp.]MDE0532843.1 MFS transporter [Albidovulum sp.]
MQIIVSFSALFLSVILLQLSSGGVAPLDALAGIQKGFSTAEIGMLGSSHFVGFFVGCWWAPRLIGSIGHSRSFAAFAASGTLGILFHTIIIDPYAWAVMRVMSGLCVAGCFTVIEAWLQAKFTNRNRGRAMGTYRMADLGAGLCAQLLISVLDPASYISYNILAIICCASLLPLLLTRIPQPSIRKAPRLNPRLAFQVSPMACIAVVTAGLTTASFRMMGPIYGIEVGLGAGLIALFLAAFIFGGAIAQYPVGWLADRYDRRWVIVGLSAMAICSCIATVALSNSGPVGVFTGAVIFGMTTFPIFSVGAAHASDFADPEQMVELSSSLLFLYAIGAIASPAIVAMLIAVAGPESMFVFIGIIHLALCVFSILRMGRRPSKKSRTPYVYTPRTSFLIGRLIRRRRRDR